MPSLIEISDRFFSLIGSLPKASGTATVGSAAPAPDPVEVRRAAVFGELKYLEELLEKRLAATRPTHLARFIGSLVLLVGFIAAVLAGLFFGEAWVKGLSAVGGFAGIVGFAVFFLNSLQHLQDEQLRNGMIVARYRPEIAAAKTEEDLIRISKEIGAALRFADNPKLSVEEVKKVIDNAENS